MSRLGNISARECVKALQRAGFRIRRQTGSHIIMQRDDPYAVVVVPNHKSLKQGTLRSILRQAEITVDAFVSLIRAD